jgi:hypothetical protein
VVVSGVEFNTFSCDTGGYFTKSQLAYNSCAPVPGRPGLWYFVNFCGSSALDIEYFVDPYCSNSRVIQVHLQQGQCTPYPTSGAFLLVSCAIQPTALGSENIHLPQQNLLTASFMSAKMSQHVTEVIQSAKSGFIVPKESRLLDAFSVKALPNEEAKAATTN